MQPLSREFLKDRGFCCGNRCMNCPYTKPHKKGNIEMEFTVEEKAEYIYNHFLDLFKDKTYSELHAKQTALFVSEQIKNVVKAIESTRIKQNTPYSAYEYMDDYWNSVIKQLENK